MRYEILLCLSVCAVGCGGQSHDFTVGQVTYGDMLLYRGTEWKLGFPFMVRTSKVVIPPPGTTFFSYIRAIYAKDNDKDGIGGFASVENGGVGHKFVNIKLKSQRGHGFNFTIFVYGRN